MTFSDALARLRAAFAEPLPGVTAHQILAPRTRRDWPAGFSAAHIRHAAGLLLLFPLGESPHVVLTVRADTLGRHGGQVSLPGGVIDPGETIEQAALREAHEEVALPLDDVEVVGALSPIDIPVSGFRLHPVVAATDAQPRLRPSDHEVARILDVSVEELLDPTRLATVRRTREGLRIAVPAFQVGGEEIWGATAMVLAEFLVLLGWPGPGKSGKPRKSGKPGTPGKQ